MLLRIPAPSADTLPILENPNELLPAEVLEGLGITATRPVLGRMETAIPTPSQSLERQTGLAPMPAHAVCQTFRKGIITVFTNADFSIGQETQYGMVGRRDINKLAGEWQRYPCGVTNDFEDPELESPLLRMLEKTPDDLLTKVVEPLRAERLRGNRGTLGQDRTVKALYAVAGRCVIDHTTMPEDFKPKTLGRLEKLAFKYRLARTY